MTAQRKDRRRIVRAAAFTVALMALAGCGRLLGDNPSVSSLAVLNDCPYTVSVSVAPEKTSGPGAYHSEKIEPGSQQGWASSSEQGEFVVIVTGPLDGEWRTTVPYSVETPHPGLTISGADCPE
jgi:hypothetical protein